MSSFFSDGAIVLVKVRSPQKLKISLYTISWLKLIANLSVFNVLVIKASQKYTSINEPPNLINHFLYSHVSSL